MGCGSSQHTTSSSIGQRNKGTSGLSSQATLPEKYGHCDTRHDYRNAVDRRREKRSEAVKPEHDLVSRQQDLKQKYERQADLQRKQYEETLRNKDGQIAKIKQERISMEKQTADHDESKVLQDSDQEPKPHTLRKNDLIQSIADFAQVDHHARQAPEELRSSVPGLVNYLSSPSKDPVYLVRAFFIWITHNIRYDTDGYFGTAEKAKCDMQSVMLTGRSVCEGYARVMEGLCNEAGIPVKKISGFSKGFSYSPDQRYSTSSKTNHAWNAVYIRKHWFLLDATWGSGHVDRATKQFVANYNEFYFLTDPEHFVFSHFPYQNGNMKESEKWQFLKKPFSLEEFNTSLDIKSAAFDIGIQPSSHKNSIVSFDNELELAFKEAEPRGNVFLTKLYRKEENMLYGETYCCYGYRTGIVYKLKVKPPKSGTYRLKLYAKKITTENNNKDMPELFEYTLECTVPPKMEENRKCPYPEAYPQAYIDECEVIEPLGKQIFPNSEIKMRFKSPHLLRMMINKKMLKKTGEYFEGVVTSPESGYLISVYGSRSESGSLGGQYTFCVA